MLYCSAQPSRRRRCYPNSRSLSGSDTLLSGLLSALADLQIRTTSPTTQLHLLNLPAELRIQIYEAVLLDTQPPLAILGTCRQIAMEAQPTLYQRHLTFPSQASLFNWIERSRSINLSRVKILTLRLSDVDLSALLDEQNGRPATQPDVWTMYQDELEKLDRALESLPNIAELSVTPPKAGHSRLLRGMYLSFLGLIPHRYPRLKRLTVEDTEAILAKVPDLKDLGSVVCSMATKPHAEDTKERQDSAISLPKAQASKRQPTRLDAKRRKRRRTRAYIKKEP